MTSARARYLEQEPLHLRRPLFQSDVGEQAAARFSNCG
jgi:hypothetical protein